MENTEDKAGRFSWLGKDKLWGNDTLLSAVPGLADPQCPPALLAQSTQVGRVGSNSSRRSGMRAPQDTQ